MIQELLDLSSEPLKLEENAATDGDVTCDAQTSTPPECNGSVLPHGFPSSGSVLPHGPPSSGSVLSHGLPNRQDVILSVSHLSANWTDVSGCCVLYFNLCSAAC